MRQLIRCGIVTGICFDVMFSILMPYQQTAAHVSNIKFDHKKILPTTHASKTNLTFCIFSVHEAQKYLRRLKVNRPIMQKALLGKHDDADMIFFN